MILFLLQRGSKAFHLNFGGLFVGSMETAAMVKEYTLLKIIFNVRIIIRAYFITADEYFDILFHSFVFDTLGLILIKCSIKNSFISIIIIWN